MEIVVLVELDGWMDGWIDGLGDHHRVHLSRMTGPHPSAGQSGRPALSARDLRSHETTTRLQGYEQGVAGLWTALGILTVRRALRDIPVPFVVGQYSSPMKPSPPSHDACKPRKPLPGRWSNWSRLSTGVFLGGMGLRVVLWALGWDETFMRRMEIATPFTAFHRLREGVFLASQGQSPYDGSAFHQSPLLLVLFTPLQGPLDALGMWAWRGVFLVADVGFAFVLREIARCFYNLGEYKERTTRSADAEGNRKTEEQMLVEILPQPVALIPDAVSMVALFNPWSLVSCLGLSTAVFEYLPLLAAILQALRGRNALAAFFLALSTQLSLYPLMLVPALVLLVQRGGGPPHHPSPSATRISVFTVLCWYFVSLALLLLLAYAPLRSWAFLSETYGTTLLVRDLWPNIGLHWYFFSEVFDRFRSFFLFVFHFQFLVITPPLTVRLRRHPLFLCYVIVAVVTLLRSYPSVADIGLVVSLVSIFPAILPYMYHRFSIFWALLALSALTPVFWYQWMYLGSGNVNFIYPMNLVMAFTEGILIVESTLARFRLDSALKKMMRMNVK